MKFDRHQLPAQMAIDIDGTFHAKIEVETTPDIAIERHIHLRRDRDAGWLVYSIPNGAMEHAGDIASGEINIYDPVVCAFLDAFYHLIADPGGFGKAQFGTYAPPPEGTEAA